MGKNEKSGRLPKAVGAQIVWALDAFGEEKAQRSAALFVQTLQRQLKKAIQPVFVLNPSSVPMVDGCCGFKIGGFEVHGDSSI